MTRYRPVTDPAEEPLTVAEVKLHLRIPVEDTSEDTLLEMLIQAARERVELTGYLVVDREWEMELDEFPDGYIEIMKTPVREILALTYTDTAGEEAEIDDFTY